MHVWLRDVALEGGADGHRRRLLEDPVDESPDVGAGLVALLANDEVADMHLKDGTERRHKAPLEHVGSCQKVPPQDDAGAVDRGLDGMVAGGTVGTALVLLIMVTVNSQVIGAALAGLSWIAVLSSLNVSAQTSLPDWVRARGLSIFLTVFFGSMSLGSLLWGQVASIWGIPTALVIATLGALVLIPLTWRARLGQGEVLDLTPSMHWPEPVLASEIAPDGPVMIQVTYQVDALNLEAFQALMPALADSRNQGGGYRWSLMNDTADPEHVIESWWEASWLDHQRHPIRVTEESRKLQDRILTLQIEKTKPTARHFVMPISTDGRDEA